MKIKIDDKRNIQSIQEEFNKAFPFLKIEFFSKPHKPGGASSKKNTEKPNQLLGELRGVHTMGDIIIDPDMTVNDLEQQFNSKFGLNIQVFRKSGKVWLETTVTDDWTLKSQNDQGESLSEFMMK